MQFHKYQGTGNDFVMIDDRARAFDETDQPLIARLCNRRFGIGADGLILLRNKPDFDFEMVYFNADGRPSSMCGNGGRCTVAFAKYLGLISTETRFLAVDGPHDARVEADGTVRLRMIDVNAPVEAGVGEEDVFLHTGSPHHIHFLDPAESPSLAEFDVYGTGHDIRYDQAYDPAGTNVNFVEIPADPTPPRPRRRKRNPELRHRRHGCGAGRLAAWRGLAGAPANHGRRARSILRNPRRWRLCQRVAERPGHAGIWRRGIRRVTSPPDPPLQKRGGTGFAPDR
jgi:diaminopimelate epimerase